LTKNHPSAQRAQNAARMTDHNRQPQQPAMERAEKRVSPKAIRTMTATSLTKYLERNSFTGGASSDT